MDHLRQGHPRPAVPRRPPHGRRPLRRPFAHLPAEVPVLHRDRGLGLNPLDVDPSALSGRPSSGLAPALVHGVALLLAGDAVDLAAVGEPLATGTIHDCMRRALSSEP
jgi:hypothetical protein